MSEITIGIMSDIHHELYDGQYEQEEVPESPDIMIIAGDLDNDPFRAIDWIERKFNGSTQVIYVAGNHEFYEKDLCENVNDIYREIINREDPQVPIHYLDNTGVVLSIRDRKIAFHGATMWTDFKLFGEGKSVECENNARQGLNDFRKIKYDGKKFTVDKYKQLHNEHMHGIKTFLDRTGTRIHQHDIHTNVVVTHHAPSLKSIHGKYLLDDRSPAYAVNLEYLMEGENAPDLWFHGHCHYANDYVHGDTRVVSNPRGYKFYDKDDRGFDPYKIVTI